MRNKLLTAAATVLAFGSGVLGFAAPARAGEIMYFSLSGAGITASGLMAFTLDTIAGDPVGANNITGISGTFSDSNLGITNASITGLVPTIPTTKAPTTSHPAFATSLTRVSVTGNSVLPAGDSNSLTYSNLLYPNGAPDTCYDGITGGFVDVFGMLLTLSNGDELNLWSNGGGTNDSAMYGIALASPTTVSGSPTSYTAVAYVGNGVTMDAPEPGTVWLFGSALLGVLALTKRPAGADRSASLAG